MRLLSSAIASDRRQFVLLAPKDANVLPFRHVAVNPDRHSGLLGEAQRLRGRTYLDLGALDRSQLLEDGRHLHPADGESWHLLTFDGSGEVAACLRYRMHPSNVSFSKLTIAHSALAKSEKWGPKLRAAVEEELRLARERGCSYVEMGGWAITQALRCTTEALRMIVTAYSLAQVSGGALGITNATLRSCSASILRRIGGRRLMADGEELPSYTETEYRSVEAEILRFDSMNPNPRYKKWMDECQAHMRDVPVISQAPNRDYFSMSFINTITFASEASGQAA
jgi:hypothetical protein